MTGPNRRSKDEKKRWWNILPSSPLFTLGSWHLHDFHLHLAVLSPTASPSLGSISINLFLWLCCQKDTINHFFISPLPPTANFYCFVSLFRVSCDHWEFLMLASSIDESKFSHQSGKLLSIFFILAELAYLSSCKYVQQICVSTLLWGAVLTLNSMFPLSFSFEILFPANPFPYDCVSPILLQETDSFSQKANLLHKKYRENSQNLGNHRYHVRLESKVSENQTRKLLSPSLGPQVSICLQLFACLPYYSHSHFTDSVFCICDDLFMPSFPESSGSWLHKYYIPIPWREKLRNPVEPMGWLPWVWCPLLDQPILETGRR